MKRNFEHTEFGEGIDSNEKEKMHENWSEFDVTTKPSFSEDKNGQTEG